MYTQPHAHTHAHAGTYRKVEGSWLKNRPGPLYTRKSREIASPLGVT